MSREFFRGADGANLQNLFFFAVVVSQVISEGLSSVEPQ